MGCKVNVLGGGGGQDDPCLVKFRARRKKFNSESMYGASELRSSMSWGLAVKKGRPDAHASMHGCMDAWMDVCVYVCACV